MNQDFQRFWQQRLMNSQNHIITSTIVKTNDYEHDTVTISDARTNEDCQAHLSWKLKNLYSVLTNPQMLPG